MQRVAKTYALFVVGFEEDNDNTEEEDNNNTNDSRM
jgi:hypothetical protein